MKTPRLVKVRLVALLGLPGIVGLASPEAARAGDSAPSSTITVQIYNYSKASPAVLVGAEREAARILGEAGLRAIWMECPMGASTPGPRTPCQQEPQATDLRLRILAAPIRHTFQDDVFGFTVHPVLASVYYDYVVRFAQIEDIDRQVSMILGCVMAHELGHLLLGPNSHSAGGIMQGQWGAKQLHLSQVGGLVFVSQQSKVMRGAARARIEHRNLTSTAEGPLQ